MRVDPAKITPEWQPDRIRGGARRRHRHAEDRVRAKPPFIGGAVQIDHGLVKASLIQGIRADQRIKDVHIHGFNGLQDALAAIA